MSQKDLDDAVGAEQSAEAAVKAAQAGVTRSEAAVEAAQASALAARAAAEKVKLDLGFTRIFPPSTASPASPRPRSETSSAPDPSRS